MHGGAHCAKPDRELCHSIRYLTLNGLFRVIGSCLCTGMSLRRLSQRFSAASRRFCRSVVLRLPGADYGANLIGLLRVPAAALQHPAGRTHPRTSQHQ